MATEFVHNGQLMMITDGGDIGYYVRRDQYRPGNPRYFVENTSLVMQAYKQYLAELDDAHEQAVLEAQDWYQGQVMLDDIRSNAPEGW